MKGLTVDGLCSVCPGIDEIDDHIFRSFQKAREVWSGRNTCNGNGKFKDQLIANLSANGRTSINTDQLRTFVIALWWIWRWKNNRIFTLEDINIQRKAGQIEVVDEEAINAFQCQENMRSNPNSEKRIRVSWKETFFNAHMDSQRRWQC